LQNRSKEEISTFAAQYTKRKNHELKNTPYMVDEELAIKVISFISMLKHTGGDLAGVEFQLLDFQIIFLIDVICTKKRSNNKRRYTTALLFIPRKNGKTELIAAVLNFFLFADTEKGKEIYCAANETNQAKIIFDATETMVKQHPTLAKASEVWKSTKTIEKNGNFKDFVKVLTANADTKDGLKPYIFVYDELHAAKDGALYTVLEEGMAHRGEPLAIIISTAGYIQNGIMKRKYEYAKQVRDGVIIDDSFYSMLFEPDEGDDWTDERVWIKCNPALGYGVKLDYLRNKFSKAKSSGEEEVFFKTKHLNIWTNAATVWIKDEVWTANNAYPLHIDDYKGQKCYCGLDLASRIDIAAFCAIFERSDGGIDCFFKFWIPEENMKERSRRDRVPYADWVRDGYITPTAGNAIDYDFIEADIKKFATEAQIEVLNFDEWNAANISNHLTEHGINIMPFRQGFRSMSAPTKMLEVLAIQGKINHQNNPVIRWMISNVELQIDSAENIKIDKGKSREKVDGAVALVMAIAGWTANKPQEETNPYEKRGMRIL
jgi:phage terminase large subunit-like protein